MQPAGVVKRQFRGSGSPGKESLAESLQGGIEALVSLGQFESARALLDFLYELGENSNDEWAMAGGARCRALLLAAYGDLEGASEAIQSALALYERLTPPHELAKTLLLAGQIHRRTRDRRGAKKSLEEALTLFEELGMTSWTSKTRSELVRVGFRRPCKGVLSPTERRVAELVATGMTNRHVADALFVSPKTIESNLASIYRKLDIHSRAELGARMGQESTAAIRSVS